MRLLKLIAIASTQLSVAKMTKSVTRLLRQRDGNVKMKNEEGIGLPYIDFGTLPVQLLKFGPVEVEVSKR